jgi:hypothetical protein
MDKGKTLIDQEIFLKAPNKSKSNKKLATLIPSTQLSNNKNSFETMVDKEDPPPTVADALENLNSTINVVKVLEDNSKRPKIDPQQSNTNPS